MPSKKKKYNARFPSGRIKKIMQTDEEVGKVAQAVPVIISRTLELFVESLLRKAMQITIARNAKTLTPSHMKQCILSESRFDFLKDLVTSLPDATTGDPEEGPVAGSVSAQSSSNHAVKSEYTRIPVCSGTHTRQPRSATVQQCQSGQLVNGTNANFYVKNEEASASYSSEGSFLVSSGCKLEPASENSDEEYEDTVVDYTIAPAPECVLASSCGTAVDEDYDT